MKHAYLIVFFFFVGLASADELKFGKPVTVTSVGKNTFIHLDSSGRRSIAVSRSGNKTVVAVTWEDNRSKKAVVYVSYLIDSAKAFSKPVALSGSQAAYEPGITALPNGRFLVGWEENRKIRLRVVSPKQMGKTIQLRSNNAKQLCLGSDGNRRVAAVWTEATGKPGATKHKRRFYQVMFAELDAKNLSVSKKSVRPVDNTKNRRDQLYPALALSQKGVVVGWEDRRHGSTRMHYSYADHGKTFSSYQWINALPRNPKIKFGKGLGAMRMGFDTDGKNFVAAVWLDKREFSGGYDVYAAFSNNNGKQFGKNRITQDMLGANMPQWHAAIAVNPKNKQVVSIWDDKRDDTADIWYSVYQKDRWSDDYTIPGGSGEGKQSNPSLAFDANGVLHIVWLDKRKDTMSLRYIRSK
jgi:hypothetical protein